MNTPQLPDSITEEKIRAIFEQLETMAWAQTGLVFTSPETMQSIFEHMDACWGVGDNSLRGALMDAWTRVQNNYALTGKAITWIAMQDAIIAEMRRERDNLISTGYESCEAELLEQSQSEVEEILIACGCEQDAVDMFLQVFYGGVFDTTTEQLIRQLVNHVYVVEMEKLENV